MAVTVVTSSQLSLCPGGTALAPVTQPGRKKWSRTELSLQLPEASQL